MGVFLKTPYFTTGTLQQVDMCKYNELRETLQQLHYLGTIFNTAKMSAALYFSINCCLKVYKSIHSADIHAFGVVAGLSSGARAGTIGARTRTSCKITPQCICTDWSGVAKVTAAL